MFCLVVDDYLHLKQNVVGIREIEHLIPECIFLLNMSIDHRGINTFDFQKTISFYDPILFTLGYQELMMIEDKKAIDFGNRFASFRINFACPSNEASSQIRTHTTFMVSSPHKVDDKVWC